MIYKGYRERHQYDPEDKIWFGEILGIGDLVSFSSYNESDLEKAFHDAVDDYLDFCKQIEKQPEVPHVRIVSGDLLDTEEGIIVHQVNCKHRMRSGVAKQIRDKYPIHYFDYMNTEPILGNICLSKINEKLYVAGVFGQDNYGYTKDVIYTDYEKLREGLLGINSVAEMYGLQVYLPYKIGCGLANGDWDTVFKIIQETIPDAIIVRKD